MTKKQRTEHKIGNQLRREWILKSSIGKKLGDNLCIFLGGVCQRGKFALILLLGLLAIGANAAPVAHVDNTNGEPSELAVSTPPLATSPSQQTITIGSVTYVEGANGVLTPAVTNDIAPVVTGPAATNNYPSFGTLGQIYTDAANVFQNTSLTNPFDIGIDFIRNGSKSGFGVQLVSVNTNSTVNFGFGVYALQIAQPSVAHQATTYKWNFLDATLNVQISKVENLPLLNIPVTFRVGSGPAVNLSSGNLLLEQSFAVADVSFNLIKGWPIVCGGGVINLTGVNVSPTMFVFYFSLVHTF